MSVLQEVDKLLADRDEKTTKKKIRAKTADKALKPRKLTKKEQQILELANNTVLPEHYETVWTIEQLNKLCEWIAQQEELAVDTETLGKNPFIHDIVGISIYAPDKGYYIPLKHIDDIKNESTQFAPPPITVENPVVGVDYVDCLPKEVVSKALKPLLEDKKRKLIWHNYKFDYHVLHNWMGIDVDCYFDTMIAQALLDENQSKALKDLAPKYLKIPADRFSVLFGKVTFDKVPIKLNPHTRTGNLAAYYAIKDTELTYKLYQFQMKFLNREMLSEIRSLLFDVEIPFVKIVAEAEQQGVRLDKDYLENVVAKQLHAELEELRQKIWAYTGKINLNSPIQKAEALYVKLKLPQVNKDKPKSTDKKTLKKLKKHHPVIQLLLDYSEKAKLTTAFADKLPKMIINGRIHTSFNTVGTKTGRMSSKDPNLQQIPARVGGLIRNAFIADEGRLLASIDFSQQELRVLTHVSKDPVLMDIYKSGKDVHSMTAVGMWNRSFEDKVTYEDFEYRRNMYSLFQDKDGNFVDSLFTDEEHLNKWFNEGLIRTKDPEQLRKDAELGVQYEKFRKSAKTVNFGIIYGMSEKGLADTLEISEEEAKVYITGYFDAYPGVKRWMAEQTQLILHQGYSKTMLGRKRRVHEEVFSGKKWMIGRGIRMAINSIIQGSSADMVKLASIKLQPLLKELDVKIVLWVHDEIIFDVPEIIGIENLRRIADVMCNALPLDCGLKSDIEVGEKWGQKMGEEELEALCQMMTEIEELEGNTDETEQEELEERV